MPSSPAGPGEVNRGVCDGASDDRLCDCALREERSQWLCNRSHQAIRRNSASGTTSATRSPGLARMHAYTGRALLRSSGQTSSASSRSGSPSTTSRTRRTRPQCSRCWPPSRHERSGCGSEPRRCSPRSTILCVSPRIPASSTTCQEGGSSLVLRQAIAQRSLRLSEFLTRNAVLEQTI